MRVTSLLARALAAGLALGLATGCVAGTEKDKSSTNSTELEFWTINLKKNFESYITGLIDGFKKQHPDAKLTWVDVPGNEVKPKLLAAVAAGKAPDVVNLTNVDLEEFIPSLTDLSPYVTDEQQKAYVPNLLEPLKPDGKLIGLPWYNGGAPVSIYNSELVSKAGLDVNNPPKTFTEALQWATKLHQATPKVYGMNGIPDVSVMQAEGVPMLSADRTKAAFNTPEAKAILSAWKDAYAKGGLAPGTTVKDDRQYPQTLDNQQVAFSAGGLPFQLKNIEKNAPDVFKKLKLAPGATGAAGTYVLPDQQTFVVPKGAKNPKLAAEFGLYLTNAENQTAFCKLVAIYPSTVESLKDPQFSTFQPGNLHDEARKLVADELPKLQLGFLGTGKDDKLTERWRENVRAMLTGTKSPDQALADAEKEWNTILAAK
ncbi:putative chitobiose transport system substrate-binding protein [Micromonospora rhizosphaerae]|uniref:Putative chitobiose transport system substrate-binding protein n=1 Tax=Micromonospora rhizosphaerae TaxID=568872 RepID=A0A1C6SAX2_9ACTN|nr:extracellular solute-binding protein [Micromonospora rhizosphaerae]SCL26620.1 putative chitobiose transport system substrate-binding protein [Micromonospora rhizosphaerae]